VKFKPINLKLPDPESQDAVSVGQVLNRGIEQEVKIKYHKMPMMFDRA